MSHPARHPDGSRWNPNYDRGEGQYSDYPPDDPRAPDGRKFTSREMKSGVCVECGSKIRKGEDKFTPIGGGGSLCKKCYRARFGRFDMGRKPPDDDDDPHYFFPFPRQGGSPPPTAGAAAVRKRKVYS